MFSIINDSRLFLKFFSTGTFSIGVKIRHNQSIRYMYDVLPAVYLFNILQSVQNLICYSNYKNSSLHIFSKDVWYKKTQEVSQWKNMNTGHSWCWTYKKADAVVIFSYHLCTSLFPLIIIMIPVSQEISVTVSSLTTSVIIMIHSAKEPRSAISIFLDHFALAPLVPLTDNHIISNFHQI